MTTRTTHLPPELDNARRDAERGSTIAKVALGAYFGETWADEWPQAFRDTALSTYGLAREHENG